jgi:DNA-binding NtrC family response regulator
MLIRCLVVTGSEAIDRRLRRLLEQEAVLVDRATELWSGLAHDSYDILVVALTALPGPADQIIATLRKLPDRPGIIVVHDGEDAVTRAKVLSAGGLAVLNLELSDAMLRSTLSSLLGRHSESLVTRLGTEGEQGYRLDDFSAASSSMQRLLDLARRVARADSSLLILGETGVGKEWLARSIHAEGTRVGGPFVAVNCAAVPESLLESELFGHEKGAFTGSVRTRRGHFELAHGGTIFLDEVADLPVHLQAKLLRVLEERRIQRLGAERPIAIDVRIMAATNRDLAAALAAQQFREDVYFRLSVVTLVVPPLRERHEDIAPLAHAYLERFAQQLGRPGLVMRQEVLEALQGYGWPGNVRELINVVERAVLLCRGSEITLADLPTPLVEPVAADRGATTAVGGALVAGLPEDWLDRPLKDVRRAAVEIVENAYLRQLLERTDGRVGAAAERAGIDPRSLYSKMRQYGIRKEAYRPARGRRTDH